MDLILHENRGYVFNSLPGLYLILSPDLIICGVSDSYLQATMTIREEIMGKHLFEVFPDNPADEDATGVSNLGASLRIVKETHSPHRMSVQKYDIREPNGSFTERYWSPLNSPVFNSRGEFIYIIHNVADVTASHHTAVELKKTENDYQLLISSVKDYAIFMIDPSGHIATWNSGAEQIKGYTSAEVIGKSIDLFYSESDIRQGIPNQNLQHALLNDRFETEGLRIRKDGTSFWAHVVITALKDDTGTLYGYTKITRDITSQKRLLDQIEHLANIVDQSSEAIISRGMDQRLISWNKGAETLFGYSRDEAIGKTAKEIGMIKFTEDEIFELERDIYENGTWRSEKEYYHKNGSSFYGVVTANAIYNEQGDMSSMVFIIKDISLRRQLEQQLRSYNEKLEAEVKERTAQTIKNEKRFRALIENSNDIVLLTDASLNVIYRSPSAQKITGWTNDELLGDQITKSIHPDDRGKVQKLMFEIMARPGIPVPCLIRNRHKNGHYLWVEGVIVNLLHDDSIAGILYNFKDVTDQKNAELALQKSFEEKTSLAERLSVILNTLPANIALLDADGFIIDVNESWRKFANQNGLGDDQHAGGTNYLTVCENTMGIGQEDGIQVAEGLRAVLSNQLKVFEYEYACHSPETKRWFKMIVSPLDGRIMSGVVVMHIDISELRKLEEERMEAKEAEQKIITKAILIGEERERNHIGQELHDNINQILVGAKLYMTLAGSKNKDVNELIKYPLELLDTSIKEIRLLCHQLVTPVEDLDLELMIGELVDKMRKSSSIKPVFIYNADTEKMTDEIQLNIYRIVQELINNILKYAFAKEVSIAVMSTEGFVSIIVKDDGKGFNTNKKRAGIGISNMINRVKSFNGQVNIVSSEGNGCETNIQIPI